MKIEIINNDNCYWNYNINEYSYTQEQYDYICKYLDFDKLDKDFYIFFNDKKTGKWFKKTYISNYDLSEIYKYSPLGYEYLKNNWCKGIFKTEILYPDKQELKTIINKVINIELIRGQNNENCNNQ